MDLTVEISLDQDGTLSITDYSQSTNTGYLSEDSPLLTNYNKFKYSLTATIDVIKHSAIDSETLIDILYVSHLYSVEDSNRIELPFDGHFTIDHIVLPTTAWLDALKAEALTDTSITLKAFFSNYTDSIDCVYIADELVNDNDELVSYTIYKYTFTFKDDGSIDTETKTQVYLIDSTNSANGIETLLNNKDTSSYLSDISASCFNVFSIARLKDCYVKAASNILNALPKCNNISETDKFNRDFLWMTINVINIWLEKDEYDMAEVVLERLGCYNFCPDILQGATIKGDCGCSKRR